jgi:hypothetical protein
LLTFTQLYKEAGAAMGLNSTDPYLPIVKRNINTGLKLLKSAAQQYYTRKETIVSLIANQQFYIMDPDFIRPRTIRINNGSIIFPISGVESESEWNALNIIPQFAVFYPQRWFLKGPNQIGVWPIPSTNVANALMIAYESRMEDMYLDDTVGISVTVTNNSMNITNNAHAFTPKMVGMKLGFTDGSDGNWYTIVGYTNDQLMTIETYYKKATQTTTGTIIGSCPDIPEEFHPALEDYALSRYYKLKRINAQVANDFEGSFLRAQEGYLATFSDKESSQIINPRRNTLGYNPLLIPPSSMDH